MLTRRDTLMRVLFGAGLVGLRSLASGIPASILLDPRRAMAAGDGGGAAGAIKPQFVLYSTSFAGDPVNCNAPGTYDDPNIQLPTEPSMVSTPMTFGSRSVSGAQSWATSSVATLSR